MDALRDGWLRIQRTESQLSIGDGPWPASGEAVTSLELRAGALPAELTQQFAGVFGETMPWIVSSQFLVRPHVVPDFASNQLIVLTAEGPPARACHPARATAESGASVGIYFLQIIPNGLK